MEGESGEQVGGELESVTSSAGCFMQYAMITRYTLGWLGTERKCRQSRFEDCHAES